MERCEIQDPRAVQSWIPFHFIQPTNEIFSRSRLGKLESQKLNRSVSRHAPSRLTITLDFQAEYRFPTALRAMPVSPTPRDSYDVFLSHASPDKAWVHTLRDQL
jgi:hypothetical protein